MIPEDPTPDDVIPDEVIDRIYEVAVDPGRFEELLDQWEAMIGPQRAAAGGGGALALPRFEGHFARASQVLDRMAGDPAAQDAAAVVARVDPAAAFAVDRALVLIAANTAATGILGAGYGVRLADLALDEGEAAALAAQVRRMFLSNSGDPVMLRSRTAAAGRLVLIHLRRMTGATGEDFVLAVTSELAWPPGFSDLLRGAFDLTPAEAEVMRALAEGHAIPAIADRRGRSIETVRAQLKSIMSKTETRSQTELVRLTLSTLEMAQFSDERTRHLHEQSRGLGGLLARPFLSMTLRDGRRLDHLILGDPGGRPVLYLAQDYGFVRWPAPAEAEAARRGLRVIVPVRPGYGRSDPIPRGTPYMAQLVEDIIALLDHLGVGRVPFLTLGADSIIAIALHAAYPERVRALVCCSGVLPLSRPEQYERMDKWHRFVLAGARYTPHLLPFMVKAGFALARRLGKRGFIHAAHGQSRADIATFERPEVTEALVCGSEVTLSATCSAHDAFARELIAEETTDWSSEVAALAGSVPVHFLNGLQDPQIPPETLAEFRADHPWIDFRIHADAGQLLFFLKWPEVIDLIEGYLPERTPEGASGPAPLADPAPVMINQT
ncbi:MAG: helix-turn-helix transcriptional regulator [Rubellimicrobium sp.]|nr:helix-turn-helix transcriptional regulator [Rubellimicrobium sp.]